jgi:hypothetical protein
MSAWIPNKEHIDLMVKTADVLSARIPVAMPKDRNALGQMLTDEVVASVAYRYDERPEDGQLPGPCETYYLEPYVYADPGFMPDAAEMRQLARCYSYQACEHPGWESSTANAICEGILTHLGEGPSAGAWGWDETTVARRIAQGEPFTETVYG